MGILKGKQCFKINKLEELFRYMLKTLDPVYKKLGFNAQSEDTHLDVKLRKKTVSYFKCFRMFLAFSSPK